MKLSGLFLAFFLVFSPTSAMAQGLATAPANDTITEGSLEREIGPKDQARIEKSIAARRDAEIASEKYNYYLKFSGSMIIALWIFIFVVFRALQHQKRKGAEKTAARETVEAKEYLINLCDPPRLRYNLNENNYPEGYQSPFVKREADANTDPSPVIRTWKNPKPREIKDYFQESGEKSVDFIRSLEIDNEKVDFNCTAIHQDGGADPLVLIQGETVPVAWDRHKKAILKIYKSRQEKILPEASWATESQVNPG